MKFDRIATGISMLVAGPLILAGMLTGVWESDDSATAMLQSYLADPSRSQISAVLLHFGYLLLLPAALGLAMVSHAAPRLRAAGLVCAILGLGTLPGLLVIDFYDLAIAHTLPIEQGVLVEEQVGRYTGIASALLLLGLVDLGRRLILPSHWKLASHSCNHTDLVAEGLDDSSTHLSSGGSMIKQLHDLGIKSEYAYVGGFASIALSYISYFVSRKKKGDDKAQSDRWGIFIGHWAPTFFTLGIALRLEEK